MSEQLHHIFLAFASYGTREHHHDMDGKNFLKCCKDTHLIGHGLTTTDVDLIFAKIKEKTARRITFAQFVHGLELIAGKKHMTLADVEAKVLHSAGPHTHGTEADYVKFHDDKGTYTGVYARGGPTNVDDDKVPDLSNLLDRSPADVRGVKTHAH